MSTLSDPNSSTSSLDERTTLMSTTDLDSYITHVNDAFVKVSGYGREEMLGKPHNLVRHPDMPKAGFEGMWKVIESGKIWEGYVKNLRKDGKFYWVVVHIVPKLNEAGEIIGYIASRKMPDRNRLKIVEEQYKELLEQERSAK